MHKRALSWLFFIFQLPIAGMLFAQLANQTLAFETINDKKGLSHHIIHSLCQDSRGFIWIGTEYGLNRYDGVSCTSFFSKPGQPNSLPNSHINQMAEDGFGNLWIGTAKGIGCMNIYTGLIQQYFNDEIEHKHLKDLNLSVFADKHKNIWAGNGHFIFKYDAARKKFEAFPFDGGQSTGNTRNYFTLDLLHDSKNRIWFATSYGIKLFNPQNNQFISYHFPEKDKKLTINAIASLAEAPDGRIFAGTWGGGLLVFSEAKNRFEPLLLPNYPVTTEKGQMFLDIMFTDDQVYLASVSGLVTAQYPDCISNPGYSGWKHYKNDPNGLRSIPGHVINRILIDKAGDIWLATDNNLARADIRMTQFQHKKFAGPTGETLLPTCFEANFSGNKDSYWVGSNGLYLASNGQGSLYEQGIYKLIEKDNNPGTIWDIHQGQKNLWLATTNGLFAFNPVSKKVVQHFTHIPGSSNSIAGSRLWKVHEDKKGRVWVGTIRQGISLIDPTAQKIQNFFGDKNDSGSLFNVTPTKFFEDASGDIWFGGNHFFYHYSYSADSFRVIPFTVKSKEGQTFRGAPQIFYEDRIGQLWIAFANGLVSFNKQIGEIKPLLLHIPFFKPVGEIVVKDSGQIWFGTTSGLFRLDTAGMRLSRFTTRDGLLSNETEAGLTLIRDGSIVTGFSGLITRFFPEGLMTAKNPPPLALSRVIVNGQDTTSLSTGRLDLPFRSTIQFEFAALSFGNSEQNTYTYKLQGADRDWSTPTENKTVTYAKLPQGKYIFLVKGSNSDGVWNETPLEYPFAIMAPFYLTWWFLALLILVAGFTIFGFYRYRLNQAIKLERLRTRLATDLHDDVGATLSAISMYAEALKKQINQPQMAGLLGKIGEDSREMVRTMSDLVWAINPKNDSVEQLIQRMENLATDLCAAANVKLSFEKDKSVIETSLNIEARRNIYLIFKEALNNALKYSQCATITIGITKTNKEFLLNISDDGVGFNEAIHTQGNGLGNMKERAREMHGILNIHTAPGAGCQVLLKCPV